MRLPADAAQARAHGRRTLAALHALIEDRLERALQRRHGLSVSEYSVLDVLARQDEYHMRMQQLAHSIALSQSATTRLVARLEKRGLLVRHLCEDDRRGIFTELTTSGNALLDQARPTHDAVLREALAEAAARPELAPLVDVVQGFQGAARA